MEATSAEAKEEHVEEAETPLVPDAEPEGVADGDPVSLRYRVAGAPPIPFADTVPLEDGAGVAETRDDPVPVPLTDALPVAVLVAKGESNEEPLEVRDTLLHPVELRLPVTVPRTLLGDPEALF